MARQVTGSTGNYLKVLTGESLPYPFTVSCRIKGIPPAGLQVVYGQVSAVGSWDSDELTGGNGGQSARGASFAGTASPVAAVADTWYLVVLVITSGADRRIYVDNGSQTAADFTNLGSVLELNKYLTVGGIYQINTGTLHPAVLADLHAADLAIWNTALTAADVDALAASRPGFVKSSNLKAWYKLGEDGSLASSVGSYPAMTVVGTVPVTTDPVYPVMPATPRILYLPDHLRDDVELDVNHPLLKDCAGWFPLHPNKPFWNPLRPDVQLVRRTDYGPTTVRTTSGADNSTRFNYGPKISIPASKQPAIVDSVSYPWSVTMGAWVKLNTLAGAGFGAYHGIIGGDTPIFLDPYESPAPRLSVTSAGQPIIFSHASFTLAFAAPVVLAVGEWAHVVACWESIYHGVRYPNAHIWLNGILVATTTNNTGLGTNTAKDNNSTISIGTCSFYTDYPGHELISNADLKDVFYYRRKLTNDEVRWLYEQPEDLYIARTPRVYFFGGSTGSIPPVTGKAHQHHHIIGAV